MTNVKMDSGKMPFLFETCHSRQKAEKSKGEMDCKPFAHDSHWALYNAIVNACCARQSHKVTDGKRIKVCVSGGDRNAV